MDYIKTFMIGGGICLIAQILMEKTKLTPGRILVLFVIIGAVLGFLGIYDRIIGFAGAGATIPLPGFGNVLAKSVIEEVNEVGFLGVFTGGMKGGAGGITAAIVFGYLMAVLFNPKSK